MLLPLFVTLLPVLFLAGLIRKARLLRQRRIDMDGDPPIAKALFVGSKYAIVVLWAAMVVQSWGVDISMVAVPGPARGVALGLWVLGFALLFSGRTVLGDSFRIGSPRERTGLKQTGLYRFSRNPMYVGVYTTLCAAVVRTFNPIVLLASLYVIAIHHRIVLAEEEHLRRTLGEEYRAYCRRVRRYV